MTTLPFDRPLDPAELRRLLDDCPVGRLLTVGPDGAPACGLHPFRLTATAVELHLLKENPQLAHLAAGSPAVFEADEFLAPIPSHWVDRHDGTAFALYYRVARVSGPVAIVDDPMALAEHFLACLERYQPEGGYDRPPPAPGLARYALVRIDLARLSGRWQLGQHHPPELRRKLIDRLRTRGRQGDHKAADELLRWLMAHTEEDVDPLKYE